MRSSDADLLRRIDSARDTEAFAAFYDRFAARVYGLLLKLLRNRTDADDVLQETFLQVWNQAGRFDPIRSIPEGWVLMLARSRAALTWGVTDWLPYAFEIEPGNPARGFPNLG